MVQFGSRKFIALCVQMILLIALPILYKRLEISDEVIMTVLIASSGVVGAYTGFNVLQKKIEYGSGRGGA